MSFHFFFANKGDFLLDKIRSIFATSTSRKLSSNASYAMRIRRDSDDAELDVGFAGNSIDNKAIKDFGGYNLLGYTEDFTHSSWLKENYGSSGQVPVITANAAANPLTGEQNAARIDFDAVNNNGISAIRQTTPYFQGEQLIEIYLKTIAGSGTKNFRMRMDSGQGAISKNFNVTENWAKYFIDVASSRTNVTGWSLRLRPLTGTDTTASVYAYAPQWVQGSTSLPYQPRLQGGASDCFVTKLYDQSGKGNDATETVVTNQPKVYDVATGDLTKENGKPAMVFDGVDDSLILINNGIIATQPNSIATVAARKGGTNSADYLFDGSNGRQILIINQNDYTLFSGLSIISSNSTDTNQHLFLGQFGLTTDKLFIDSIEVASGNAGSNNLGGMIIGASSSNNNHTLDGVIQEIIIFDQNLTTKERTLLHSDINNHFNIY